MRQVETFEEALEGIAQAARDCDARLFEAKTDSERMTALYRMLGSIDAHYQMATGKEVSEIS